MDHIIIGEDDYYSFADSGKLQQYRDNFTNMKIKGIISAGKLHHYDNTQSLNWNIIPQTLSQSLPGLKVNASSLPRR